MSGAEVTPDVDVSKNRFIINISMTAASKDENVRLILEDVSGGRMGAVGGRRGGAVGVRKVQRG